ncbi:MAG TPA: DinB family protein [Ktedonobacteraceae bacterium]|nr:DinB family protein [Ktedonobacteraceae bacterium]
MNIIDFFLMEQQRLHSWMRAGVSGLTVDEWHYQGAGASNSIAFIVWHCVRTEDNILRFILQGRPPIWNEGKWHERLNLPPRVQGTGMAIEEARTFHIADPKLFMQYAEEVWREFEEYTASITDGGAELSARTVMVKPIGNMQAMQAIGQVCITHCFAHYGEIAYMLGEMDKKGFPY